MHPEARLEDESLDFRRKARVSRRAGVIDGRLLGKLALTRGRVPLSVIRVGINESRFATRAWACGERVRYPTIFPKSLIRYLMNEG